MIRHLYANWMPRPGEQPPGQPEPPMQARPDERSEIEQRLAELDRRVRYLEERLRVIERGRPRGA